MTACVHMTSNVPSFEDMRVNETGKIPCLHIYQNVIRKNNRYVTRSTEGNEAESAQRTGLRQPICGVFLGVLSSATLRRQCLKEWEGIKCCLGEEANRSARSEARGQEYTQSVQRTAKWPGIRESQTRNAEERPYGPLGAVVGTLLFILTEIGWPRRL